MLDVFEAPLLIMYYVLGLLLIANPFPAPSFTEAQIGHLLSTFMMSSKDSFVVYLILSVVVVLLFLDLLVYLCS